MKHAAALADVEARWANLRAAPKVLSEREALELVAPLGDWWIAQYRDNPSSQTVWRAAYSNRVFAPAAILDQNSLNTLFIVKEDDLEIARTERWCKEAAAAMSTSRGLQLDEAGIRPSSVQRGAAGLDRRPCGYAHLPGRGAEGARLRQSEGRGHGSEPGINRTCRARIADTPSERRRVCWPPPSRSVHPQSRCAKRLRGQSRILLARVLRPPPKSGKYVTYWRVPIR